MNVFKYDIITEPERWMEGDMEGRISNIQYGEANEGAHTLMHKSISVDSGSAISPPPA